MGEVVPRGPGFVQWSLRCQRCRRQLQQRRAVSASRQRPTEPGQPRGPGPVILLLCQAQCCRYHTVHDGSSPPPRLHSPTRKIKREGRGEDPLPFKSTSDTAIRHHCCSDPIGQISESGSHTLSQRELEDVALILSHSCLARQETKEEKKHGAFF